LYTSYDACHMDERAYTLFVDATSLIVLGTRFHSAAATIKLWVNMQV
jgi:hypothetical protein